MELELATTQDIFAEMESRGDPFILIRSSRGNEGMGCGNLSFSNAIKMLDNALSYVFLVSDNWEEI